MNLNDLDTYKKSTENVLNLLAEDKNIKREFREIFGGKRESCETCVAQEGRHYCLLHGKFVKNMDITKCKDWEGEPDEPKEKGAEMLKNHIYDDKKYIHLCEGARIHESNPDTYLVWTSCGIDVPANKCFVSDECITCPDCCIKIKEAHNDET